MMALLLLPFTAPVLAAEKQSGPTPVYQGPERPEMPWPVPAHLATIAPDAPRPEIGFEFARSLAQSMPDRASEADRLLSIRRGLGLIVNGGIRDVRKERIALGLHFARSF